MGCWSPGWVALAVAMTVGCTCARDPEPAPARNAVLIVVDTLRADHLEPYGYPRPTSPALAALAARSVVFDRAYSHAPWTKPSVATLLTSLPPRDHGIADWDQPLAPEFLTLAEHLTERGVHTEAHISHHAFKRKVSGFEQGFSVYGGEVLDKGSPHEVSSSAEVADAAIALLDAQPMSRFFLWLHFFDPHWAYLDHPDFDFGESPVQRYDSEIGFTDFHIGRFLEALQRSGYADDTVVIFVADHGEEFGDHGGEQHTTTLYEEVLRVPLMIQSPGLAPRREPHSVGLIDVAPTLLTLLGEPVPEAFAGTPIPRAGGSLVLTDHRPVIAETRRAADKRGVVLGDAKIIVDRQARTTALYDLGADPSERAAVLHDHPEPFPRLAGLLDAHYAQTPHEAPHEPLDGETTEALRSLGYLDDQPPPD